MKFKYIFSLFFAMLSFFSVAQQVNNTEFKTKTLQVFQNLDKNRVPHGILLDFGMEFTNLQAFNGTLTDSTYTNSQTMSDIYKTLLMCRVRSNVTTGFITPQEYATRWYSQRTKGVITLSGQYFKYNRFADNAYPNKINYSNNKFSDKFVGSVWQNPYEEKQLFAMTTSIAKYKGLNFQVKLPSNLFLTNYPALVQNIQVDFSDGLGYRTVTYNQLINVSYTQANTYTWKYKITLTNGQTLLSHSKIEIEAGLNAIEMNTPTSFSQLSSSQLVTSQAIIQPPPANLTPYYKRTITATTSYNGYYGSATIYIRYASGTTITKPLIVAEGFDTGIILNPEQEAGDNNIEDFLFNINTSNSSLSLETNQYDIIYVDWNNGVDFIQRNAFVLEEVIKWVNQNKSGSQQNVVLGQSMGGLIARYALKDMENKGLNHDTRLYVSHDAPQLGANTPLSVQYSARHLRNMYIQTPLAFTAGDIILPLIQDFAQGFSQIINFFGGNTSSDSDLANQITPLQAFSLADVPAARQMQYNWVNRSYGINNIIHDAWQQELSNIGYPAGYPTKPIRNIAIANGSECGVSQIDNGNITSYIKDAGRGTFLSNYVGILDSFYASLINRPDIMIVSSLFPGKSYWQIDFQSKYMTTLNESKNIYHGNISYKKKIFWFIPITITVTNKDVNQPSGYLPYDIYGGGNQTPPASEIPLSSITTNSFGFIPTASALDIGKGTSVINDVDYRKSYVGALPPALPKNSPFQNFVTHFDQNNLNNNNSRHISFNRRNGNWLRTELNTIIADEYTNCSFICDNVIQISGLNKMCTNGETYSVNLPSSLTPTWSITQGSNLVTLINNGNGSVTLTSDDYSGTITLAASFGNDTCGYKTITKNITIGNNIYNYSLTLIDSYCESPFHYFVLQPSSNVPDQINGISNFYPSDGIFTSPIDGNNNVVLRTPYNYIGDAGFEVLATNNSCGKFKYVFSIGGIQDCQFIQPARMANTDSNFYKVYPNPSNNLVNIELISQEQKPNRNAVIIGELFNMMGEIKSNVSIRDNIATINVASLPKGIYVLKINIDGIIESHQVAVE